MELLSASKRAPVNLIWPTRLQGFQEYDMKNSDRRGRSRKDYWLVSQLVHAPMWSMASLTVKMAADESSSAPPVAVSDCWWPGGRNDMLSILRDLPRPQPALAAGGLLSSSSASNCTCKGEPYHPYAKSKSAGPGRVMHAGMRAWRLALCPPPTLTLAHVTPGQAVQGLG